MTWETVAPRSGERARSAGLTVAWRRSSSRSNPVLVITLAGWVVRDLGLEKTHRLTIQRDRAAGRMRLCLAAGTADKGVSWKPSWRDGCVAVSVPLDDVVVLERKPAQATPYVLPSAGVLELTLPPWARPAPAFVKVPPASERAAR